MSETDEPPSALELSMTTSEQIQRMEFWSWWHSIKLGGGVVTPSRVPLHYLMELLAHLRFPESLAGLSVLDIGAWDEFLSFEAAQVPRGAGGPSRDFPGLEREAAHS